MKSFQNLKLKAIDLNLKLKIFRKLKSETKLSESNVALEIMVKDWVGRGNKNWNMRTETWGLILSIIQILEVVVTSAKWG